MNRPTKPPPSPPRGRAGVARRSWNRFRALPVWLQVALALVALWLVAGQGGDEDGTDVASASAETAVADAPTIHPTDDGATSAPEATATPAPDLAATPEPGPEPETSATRGPRGGTDSPAATWTVVNVVDGDTLDVRAADGAQERVRIVGIDTPERGECGYGEASIALADLVMGSEVDLVAAARDDRDRYDRILRYVDVGGTDAGLALIEQGLARARYDSRDGYGPHPREDVYVAADAAMPDITCEFGSPGSAPPAGAAPTDEGGGDVGHGDTTVYTNCAALNQVYPGGVARSDVTGNTVRGVLRPFGTPPHVDDALYARNTARDGDKDGIACEP